MARRMCRRRARAADGRASRAPGIAPLAVVAVQRCVPRCSKGADLPRFRPRGAHAVRATGAAAGDRQNM